MNAQTRIIWECMQPQILLVEHDWWNHTEVFTAQHARWWWQDALESFPEDYDEPWFPVVAVRGAEELIDYQQLAALWTSTWADLCRVRAAEDSLLDLGDPC